MRDLPSKILTELRLFWNDHLAVLPPSETLLIGVSGGVDSLVLTHGLIHAKPEIKDRLLGVTYDHGLRPNSAQEASAVQAKVERWGVRAEIAALPVREKMSEFGSAETTGRVLRYRALASRAKKAGASVVLVAHHADDQAESILMHLIRGTGLQGLRGMRPVSPWPVPNADGSQPPLKLMRPLLTLWKSDIIDYAQLAGLNPVEDFTNADQSMTRNRIRHAVIPLLETINPRVKHALVNLGNVAADDLSLINHLHAEAYADVITPAADGWLQGQLSGWQNLSQSSQRAVILKAVQQVAPPAAEITSSHVQEIVDLLAAGQTGTQNSANGLAAAFLYYDHFLIGPPGNDPAGAYCLPQYRGEPQSILVDQNELQNRQWRLANRWALTTDPAPVSDLPAAITALSVDLPQPQAENRLELRTRQPGDFIYFRDRDNVIRKIKLKSLFINHKIPQPLRQYWPLIARGSEILWVVGLRTGVINPEHSRSGYRLFLRKIGQ